MKKKEVFIKYNPYTLETEVRIERTPVKDNSLLNVGNQRLQEWIENLPKNLKEECNVQNFNVEFHGTRLDYEDVLSVANFAKESNISIDCKHIPAQEVGDKQQAIAELLSEIQKGPFAEFKQSNIINAFNQANNEVFEVIVLGTMSAGKSTLINALLGQELMPVKNEACTSTITKIKDNDSVSNIFSANCLNKDEELISSHPKLTLDIMTELNANTDVSRIDIEGNIPFVSSDVLSLILVDTPGPNNARDPKHREATYRMLDESSKMLVLYVLNANHLEVADDDDFLNKIAERMSIAGKQSKDRFMFIINKLDTFNPSDDDIKSSIKKARASLEYKEIKDANIFPAAALPALNIRTIQKKHDNIDDNLQSDTSHYSERVNKNPMLHLEQYSKQLPKPLPASLIAKVDAELEEAKKKPDDAYAEALIHTGIRPIELAIDMYIQKYAKTAQIKNIVDTFYKKLESANLLETAKKDIMENKDKRKEILANIKIIQTQLKSGEETKKFKAKIDAIDYYIELRASVNRYLIKAQQKITNQISSSGSQQLSRSAATEKIRSLIQFAEALQAETKIALEDVVNKHLMDNGTEILKQYKNKIAGLTKNLDINTDVDVNPFSFISDDIKAININTLVNTEIVLVRTEKVKSETVFYNPLTWFGEDYDKEIFAEQEYVDSSEIAQRFFAPIQAQLHANGDNAIEYAQMQANKIKLAMNNQITELDSILNSKLEELVLCTSAKKEIEVSIKNSEERLAWLEKIKKKMEDILAI